MPTGVSLEADCSKCAALCCVALAFDKSNLFAFDKANGQICPHLGENARCTIHGDLHSKGFAGCVQYSCHGAGQRVVQEVFEGKSWQDNPALLQPMLTAFAAMGRIHELILMLETARAWDLPSTIGQTLRQHLDVLNPAGGWNVQTLKAFDGGSDAARIRTFLKTLAPFAR